MGGGSQDLTNPAYWVGGLLPVSLRVEWLGGLGWHSRTKAFFDQDVIFGRGDEYGAAVPVDVQFNQSTLTDAAIGTKVSGLPEVQGQIWFELGPPPVLKYSDGLGGVYTIDTTP